MAARRAAPGAAKRKTTRHRAKAGAWADVRQRAARPPPARARPTRGPGPASGWPPARRAPRNLVSRIAANWLAGHCAIHAPAAPCNSLNDLSSFGRNGVLDGGRNFHPNRAIAECVNVDLDDGETLSSNCKLCNV